MPDTRRQVEEFIALFGGDPDKAMAAIRESAAVRPQRSAVDGRSLDQPVVIAVHNATKVHHRGKQRVEALRGVSLDIHAAEFLAITGASGSGKSTLLQLLGGLDRPTYGSVKLDGTDINQLKDADLAEFRNRTIGFVFQFFYLQPFLTVRQNLEVPAMFAHESALARQSRVGELLERVGLAEMADRKPKELSGGQIQRAAIARALLNMPKILLADEPTGNLDSANSRGIIDLFEKVRAELGTTIVIVTHNPEIAAVADREIHLSDGLVQA